MRWLLAVVFLLVGCSETTAPPSHAVVMTPESAEVFSGASLQFRAEVHPEGSDQTLNWQVAGPGTISNTGLYQAPEFGGNAENDLLAVISAKSSSHGVSASARVTIPAAASLVQKGWGDYAAGNTTAAGEWFDRALSTFENYPPALVGNAWIDFKADRVEIAMAVWLEAAGAGNIEALAGLVLAFTSTQEPDLVILNGKDLLNMDSQYVFPGDPQYSASDIRWLIARAGLDSGQYLETAAQLNVLVPGHGLDPLAATFPEDALLLLESIQGNV